MKNKNKKIISTIVLSLMYVFIMACPVCEKQQPALTRGLTHGAVPNSDWDWVIVVIMTIITLLTLFYSVKYLVIPGEKNENHIKNSILS